MSNNYHRYSANSKCKNLTFETKDTGLFGWIMYIERNENHNDLVSPKIWIPLSLIVSFMNAASNEIKSKISAYHLVAIFLISPSIFFSSLALSLIYGS